MGIPRDIRTTFVRFLASGLALSVLAAVAAGVLERARFGNSDEASVARVETEVRAQFDTSAGTLSQLASQIAAQPDLIRSADRDPESAGRLFDVLRAALPPDALASTGITVYDASVSPVAWAGRVVDVQRSRLDTATALFVAPDALGSRLVWLEPIIDRASPFWPRLGTIVAEQLLTNARSAPALANTFVLSGRLVPVSFHTPPLDQQAASAYAFTVPDRDGQVLVEARIMPSDLADAHARWRARARAVVLSIIGLTLVLCVAPVIELRRRRPQGMTAVVATAGLFGIVAVVRLVCWLAARPLLVVSSLAQPFAVLANALTLVALVWITLDLTERRRLGRPRPRLLSSGVQAAASSVWLYVVAGAVDASALWTYERFLQGLVSRAGLDLLHFSLHPVSAARVAMSFGLVLLHAGVIWTGALVLRLVGIGWRWPRRLWLRITALVSWIGGIIIAAAAAHYLSGPVPLGPFALALAATGGCAMALARPRGLFRRASQATRLGFLYLALLVPALALYPSLEAFARDAQEQVVAGTFGPEARNLREDLQSQSDRTLEQINAMPDLPSLVEGQPDAESPRTDHAFTVWSRTTLRERRTTSAIELYDANGSLVSRFALHLPEYTLASHSATSCDWVLFEEASSFAASERHVLRATRGICTPDGIVGTIVVRVMLDYGTLPFISSQRPYVESLRPEGQAPAEGEPGRDVEFTVYGWSAAPLYTFGSGVWPLADDLFARLVRSRQPFWATVTRDDGRTYQVYFLNDQGGIYALGYPVVTTFGHLVNLAELIFITVVLYPLLVGGVKIFNAITSTMPAGGRALLREVRSSFYLKLWLAFVGVVLVPVLILAWATHTYFDSQFRAGVKEDAVKTATVAQRLVEDYATIEQRGPGAFDILDDEVMVLVSQALDQDVNLFDPKRLQATSERDLFASGMLPGRTPGDIYQAVVLDRLPTFVGEQEVGVGGASYLLAAAPVRAGQRQGIVTVPLTLRAQEAEQQIDNLDRQVLFASVFFVLLGGGLGYWMAERIADPVSRLTRATRRIARGDLDARIAAASSDELGRLVDDFNRMAGDLKRQRSELERTQRLDAWADMARQVAHDIKNPLTPIQLSAEHARRVNIDRGRPLSPVLDECVTAILTQVRLLRQISAEFSSFASSPTPRPEPTDVLALIEEVVGPYRVGLAGRVDVDVRVPETLPDISIDRMLFSRALTNIIENALYAMPGGGKLTIVSRQSAAGRGSVDGGPRSGPGGNIVVSVSDTGVGMDQEALAKIFEPYFSTKASGTGLGLTIAKRNVELNGGTIHVESQRGVGTTVTMTLAA